MTHFHNGYELVIFTRQESGHWCAWVKVKLKATGLDGIEVRGDNGRRFETRDEAETAALRVGKDWIDQYMSGQETREELGQRMDALARRFAKTRYEAVRAEILELAQCLAEMGRCIREERSNPAGVPCP